jgi:hypothetical protein
MRGLSLVVAEIFSGVFRREIGDQIDGTVCDFSGCGIPFA